MYIRWLWDQLCSCKMRRGSNSTQRKCLTFGRIIFEFICLFHHYISFIIHTNNEIKYIHFTCNAYTCGCITSFYIIYLGFTKHRLWYQDCCPWHHRWYKNLIMYMRYIHVSWSILVMACCFRLLRIFFPLWTGVKP